MDAGLFRKFPKVPMRRVFGLHNWPGLPVGQFAVFDAEVTAAVDLFDIEIRGQGGHAAIPHKGNDALLAAAQFMNLAQTLVSRDTDPADTAVVSFTACHAGENYNVLPATVHLKGTLRYFRKQTRRTLVTGMRRLLSSVCGAYGLKGNFTEKTVTVATINERSRRTFANPPLVPFRPDASDGICCRAPAARILLICWKRFPAAMLGWATATLRRCIRRSMTLTTMPWESARAIGARCLVVRAAGRLSHHGHRSITDGGPIPPVSSSALFASLATLKKALKGAVKKARLPLRPRW